MGMKQRLALAIALMSRPKLLILDEPSNGLDPRGIIELRSTLKQLVKNEGISILFSTHQLGEIEKIADRIICINKGKIVEIPNIQYTQLSYIITFNDDYSDLNLMSILNFYADVEKLDHLKYKILLREEDTLKNLIKKLNDSCFLISDIYHEVIDIETIYEDIYHGNLI